MDLNCFAMFEIKYFVWTVAIIMLLTPNIVHGGVLPGSQRSSKAEIPSAANSTLNMSMSRMHGHHLPICVDHPTWTGQGIRNDDCQVVTKRLYNLYKDYFWSYYQFADRDAIPGEVGPEEVVRTPIKLSYSKCLPKTRTILKRLRF